MTKPASLVLALSALLVILFSGCAGTEARFVSVWTDRPEVAAYIEAYNVAQERFRAGVELVDSVSDALLQRDDHPDLIIGRYLSNETTLPLLAEITGPVEDIGREHFYPGLLALGSREETQYLVPLSFNLPGVMFNADPEITGADNEAIPDFAISLEELQELGTAFNTLREERYVRMGFSPRWNSRFPYTSARLFGADFREAEERFAEWDRDALSASISFLRSWTQERNGGAQAEDVFEEQYLYDPPYQLVLRERIRFAAIDSGRYFRFTDEQRDAVDFRWLQRGGVIPVMENVVFAGIPAESRNRDGGLDLLRWLFRPESQEALLRMVVSKQLPTFGVAGGLSAFPEVNELALPEIYPSLLGMIPPARMLQLPGLVPKDWGPIKEDVVQPWLRQAIADGSEQSELERRIRSWVLQKGE